MVANSAPQHAQPSHVSYFRPAELLVLFERVGDAVERIDGSLDYEAMREAFQIKAGVRLLPGEDPFRRMTDSDPSEFIDIRRQGRPQHLVRSIALERWRDGLANDDGRGRQSAGLEAATTLVPRACDSLNDNANDIVVGDWQLVAATPNWRAVAFQEPEGGGPGGRPIRPAALVHFRPGGNPGNVREAVRRCIGDDVSDNARSSSDIRVAILDTWPMDDEPGLPLGGRPNAPLARIENFIATHAGAATNDQLRAAAAGSLIPPNNFRDYVSGHPTRLLPMRHYNWQKDQFEPFYDVSDHGLFIAGLIEEIAPDAERALYRVLNRHGTTDLKTLVQALQDAITDARRDNKKLVINMSLGFAPALTTIKDLLARPFAKQEANSWKAMMQTNAHSDEDYQNDPFIDANALAQDGLAGLDGDGNAKTLLGALKLVGILFGLDEEPDVFAVASAGNDSHGPAKRFGPRLPAFVEGILGVSAAGASYSNRDDIEPQRDDAVAAFGGLAETSPAGSTSDTTQGLVGLAITEELPPPLTTTPGGTPPVTPNNSDGRAEWAGTSFAAPVASGLAACIWTEKLAKGPFTPQQLMTAIVGPLAPNPRREIELRQV